MNARPFNEALCYIRRSGKRQELSLEMQLGWATREAMQRGLHFDASPVYLQQMLGCRQHTYKSIRLDDAISGSDLERPGFRSLIADALANKSISHVLIYRRDRFARPQEAVEMLRIEKQLSHAGITIVFSDAVVDPYLPGQGGIERDIMALLAYTESGNYLPQLAERVILAHQSLAAAGYSTGGIPPYGHVRALFDPLGNFVEVLPKGRTVRQEGYHVRWVPGTDPENQAKIQVWLYILDLKYQGWGGKRIANYLNELEIPSPGAGLARTDQGVRHRVSGKWGHNTVLSLCENTTIVGLKQYGRRSEGKHRRIAESGWRLPDQSDEDDKGRLKIITNPSHLIVQAEIEASRSYDVEKFQEIQVDTAKRGECQRGIPRASDPAKYPMSCRVFDMTDGCGCKMYGTQASQRKLYKCGRYMRTAGSSCNNNAVDAEALLRFVLSVLRQRTVQSGDREALRARLLRMAQESLNPLQEEETTADKVRKLANELNILNSELDTIRPKMARETDPVVYEALREEYSKTQKKAESLKTKIASLQAQQQKRSSRSANQEVEAALSLLDNISRITADPTARTELADLFNRLGCRIGLTFIEAIKGKKRRIRQLAGGILVFGNRELPVPIHGDDRLEDEPPGEEASVKSSSNSEKLLGWAKRHASEAGEFSPTSGNARPGLCHREGVSLTKVNRGDRI